MFAIPVLISFQPKSEIAPNSFEDIKFQHMWQMCLFIDMAEDNFVEICQIILKL